MKLFFTKLFYFFFTRFPMLQEAANDACLKVYAKRIDRITHAKAYVPQCTECYDPLTTSDSNDFLMDSICSDCYNSTIREK